MGYKLERDQGGEPGVTSVKHWPHQQSYADITFEMKVSRALQWNLCQINFWDSMKLKMNSQWGALSRSV